MGLSYGGFQTRPPYFTDQLSGLCPLGRAICARMRELADLDTQYPLDFQASMSCAQCLNSVSRPVELHYWICTRWLSRRGMYFCQILQVSSDHPNTSSLFLVAFNQFWCRMFFDKSCTCSVESWASQNAPRCTLCETNGAHLCSHPAWLHQFVRVVWLAQETLVHLQAQQ